MKQRWAGFAVHHPQIILVLSLTLFVFGILSVRGLTQLFIPNVNSPSARVLTIYPGADATSMDSEVTDVLQEAFNTLPRLKKTTSESFDGYTFFELEFRDGTDIYEMLPEIRSKVNQVMDDLPDGILGIPTVIAQGSELLPIYSFSLESPLGSDELVRLFSQEIEPRIMRIQGVSRTAIYGGEEDSLWIMLDEKKMSLNQVNTLNLYQQLKAMNNDLPAGWSNFEEGRYSLVNKGEWSNLSDIKNIIVGSNNGKPIYLADIANIEIRPKDPDQLIIRNDEKQILVVDVMKRAEGDTVDICKALNEYVDEVNSDSSSMFHMKVLQDNSRMISQSRNTVIQSALMGLLLAVLVIFIFLRNLRSTLVISLSLPLSILFAFIGMKLSGRTLNFLSLTGLTVSMGMIVDCSIVVLENIMNHTASGKSILSASEDGTREVGGAVLASTTTTVSVFLPLITLSGIVGIFLKDISITLVFSLIASLLVSIFVVPFLSSKILKETDHAYLPFMDRFFNWLSQAYGKLLKNVLKSRWLIYLTGVVVLISTLILVDIVGISYIPSTDNGEFYVFFETPTHYSVQDTSEVMAQAEKIIRDSVPEIENITLYAGTSSEQAKSNFVPNKGYAHILLKDDRLRKRSVQEIISSLQVEIAGAVPDLKCIVENGGMDKLMSMASDGYGIQIQLQGNDISSLVSHAEVIRSILGQDPAIFDTSIDMETRKNGLQIRFLPDELSRLGISSYEAGLISRLMFYGLELGSSVIEGYERDIFLSSQLKDKALNQNTLSLVSVPSGKGDFIPLNRFSHMEKVPGPAPIRRIDGVLTVTVTGYSHLEDLSDIIDRLQLQIDSLDTPHGVTWSFGGQSGLIQDSINRLISVIIVAIFLVYVVMVIQFERFRQPFIILFSIPFCLIGVVVGLIIFGSTLSMISFLAIIALAGIVVNNGIVLLEFINSLRKQGKSLYYSLRKGTVSRLRPILMTSLTTLLGVLPLALSSGNGAEIYAPIGQAICGGLLSSTLMTLIFIPVLYYELEQYSLRKKKKRLILKKA